MVPLTVTVASATSALGIGTTKLYELIKSGDLEKIKIGRRSLITVSSINRLVANAEGRCPREQANTTAPKQGDQSPIGCHFGRG